MKPISHPLRCLVVNTQLVPQGQPLAQIVVCPSRKVYAWTQVHPGRGYVLTEWSPGVPHWPCSSSRVWRWDSFPKPSPLPTDVGVAPGDYLPTPWTGVLG